LSRDTLQRIAKATAGLAERGGFCKRQEVPARIAGVKRQAIPDRNEKTLDSAAAEARA
jgi:hypothetical protein